MISPGGLAVCLGHQQDSQTVENEHQDQVNLGFAGCTFKFLPGKNAPERGDHGSGLSNGVGNREGGCFSGNDIEDSPDAPYATT